MTEPFAAPLGGILIHEYGFSTARARRVDGLVHSDANGDAFGAGFIRQREIQLAIVPDGRSSASPIVR